MFRNYSRFFSIEFGHEYFLNRQCPDLEVIPTPDSQALFRRLNIQGRQLENKYITLMGDNGNQEPFINGSSRKFYRADYGKAIFRFYLTLKDPVFLNYTNINPTPRKIFYFSNLVNNQQSNFLFLTNPVEEFATNKVYQPGSLVHDGRTGQVYEANSKHLTKKKSELSDLALWAPKGLKNLATPPTEFTPGKSYQAGEIVTQREQVFEATRQHTSTSEEQLQEPGFWINRDEGHLQYPTPGDQLEFSNNSYTFTLAEPITQAHIAILGFNYAAETPAYDVPVSPDETQNFNHPVNQVSLKLGHLKPGKYQIKINKEIAWVYYDPHVPTGKVLGIIEIFNHLAGKEPYALLTDEEKFKKVNYSILFPSRRVLWKYIRKDARAQTITDVGTTAYQFKLKGDYFVSTVPIPLSESVLKTLKLEFNTLDFKMSPLPNPSVQRLSNCTQDDFSYLCSEMYLNY